MPPLDDKKTELRGRAVIVDQELDKTAKALNVIAPHWDIKLFEQRVGDVTLLKDKTEKADAAKRQFMFMGIRREDQPSLDSIHVFKSEKETPAGKLINYYITDKLEKEPADNKPIFYYSELTYKEMQGTALLLLDEKLNGTALFNKKGAEPVSFSFSVDNESYKVSSNERVRNGNDVHEKVGFRPYTQEEVKEAGQKSLDAEKKEAPKKVGMFPAGMILQVAEASDGWKTPKAPQLAGKIKDLF